LFLETLATSSHCNDEQWMVLHVVTMAFLQIPQLKYARALHESSLSSTKLSAFLQWKIDSFGLNSDCSKKKKKKSLPADITRYDCNHEQPDVRKPISVKNKFHCQTILKCLISEPGVTPNKNAKRDCFQDCFQVCKFKI